MASSTSNYKNIPTSVRTRFTANATTNRHLLPPPPPPPPPPQPSPRRRIFTIKISKPKIQYKFPKLGFKKMQRNNNGEAAAKKDWRMKSGRPRKSFAKKISSFFSRVFGRKKSRQTDDKMKGLEILKQDNAGFEETHLAEQMCNSFSLERVLKNDDIEEEQRITEQNRAMKKLSPEKSLSFSFFMDQKTNDRNMMNLSRGRAYNSVITCYGDDSGSSEQSSSIRTLPGKSKSSRMMFNRKKWSMLGHSARQKSNKNIDNEETDDQLCKKRILMGEKCKPIGSSGKLEYDDDGILLPDIHHDDY